MMLCIHNVLMQQYFRRDVFAGYGTREENPRYVVPYCGHCKEKDDGSLEMIACDHLNGFTSNVSD